MTLENSKQANHIPPKSIRLPTNIRQEYLIRLHESAQKASILFINVHSIKPVTCTLNTTIDYEMYKYKITRLIMRYAVGVVPKSRLGKIDDEKWRIN